MSRPTAFRVTRAVALVAAGILLPAPPVLAGGFWVYEMGTPDLGIASAGRAAFAQDAAMVFGFPAGMTSLEGSQPGVAGRCELEAIAEWLEASPDPCIDVAAGDGRTRP